MYDRLLQSVDILLLINSATLRLIRWPLQLQAKP